LRPDQISPERGIKWPLTKASGHRVEIRNKDEIRPAPGAYQHIRSLTNVESKDAVPLRNTEAVAAATQRGTAAGVRVHRNGAEMLIGSVHRSGHFPDEEFRFS